MHIAAGHAGHSTARCGAACGRACRKGWQSVHAPQAVPPHHRVWIFTASACCCCCCCCCGFCCLGGAPPLPLPLPPSLVAAAPSASLTSSLTEIRG